MSRKKNKKLKSKNKEVVSFEEAAKPFLIRRLVAAGIIPSRLFLSALVIARNNSFLQKYGALILIIVGLLYIFVSAALLLVYEWGKIPFLIKPAVCLFMLAAFCTYTKIKDTDSLKGQVGMLLSCTFTGILLYLSLNNQVSSWFNWQICLLWLIIITPWLLMAKKESVSIFWLSVFMAGLIFYGTEYAMPYGLLNWSEFFPLSAVCLFVLLGIREFCFIRYKWFYGNLTRLLLLFCIFSLAFTPVLLFALGFGGGGFLLSAAVFLLLFALAFGLYYSILKDLKALTLIIYAFCAFCLVSAYISYITYGNLIPSFALIVIPFGFFSWFMFRFKQKHSALKENIL